MVSMTIVLGELELRVFSGLRKIIKLEIYKNNRI